MRPLLFLAVATAALTFGALAPDAALAQAPASGTATYYPTPVNGYSYAPAYGYAYPSTYGYGYAPAYNYYYVTNLPPPNLTYYSVAPYYVNGGAWTAWAHWERMHSYQR